MSESKPPLSTEAHRALAVVVVHARFAEAAQKVADAADADGFTDEELSSNAYDLGMSAGMLLIHAIGDALRILAPNAPEERIDEEAHGICDAPPDRIRYVVRDVGLHLAEAFSSPNA